MFYLSRFAVAWSLQCSLSMCDDRFIFSLLVMPVEKLNL